MEYQPQTLRSGTDIIHKADECYQSQCHHKPRIFPMIRQEIDQCTELKNNPATTQSNFCM